MDKWIRWAGEIRKATLSYKIDTEELEREEMEGVMVAESTERGTFNPEVALEFHSLDQVKVFAEMLRSSEEIEGIEIEVAPDFDLLLQFKGGEHERYQLWLGKPNRPSVITHLERTDVVWRLPEHTTNQLIDALELDT
ncbi:MULTISPECIES: hypothetical protein [unclassified Exiguobacterium]|uniref:hypothetical protein n=1 Tax=unclassified Exiguobacterium TaxID=2644629 RepID=UPI001BE7244B|nr:MULTISPECIES: hypothetical protein [unclassified Exiguobacterium]